MNEYERQLSEKPRWTWLDRVGVTMLATVIAFAVGTYVWYRALRRPTGWPQFSFNLVLWVTAAVAAVTFLLTFTDRFDKWLTGRK